MSALNPNSAPGPSSPTTTTAATLAPPVYAAFSPSTSASASAHHRRTTLLVHQKSPLLVATPPQVTRALAYSHRFISPLSKFAGLLSWSTPDPWESFLLVAGFWFVVLYGDVVIRTCGPLLLAASLILGMYTRRFSPLSSTGWATRAHEEGESARKRPRKETQSASHHKSLDEIVQSLQTLTARCNILLDPLLDLTDFLSTQHTATTATTRPALTVLFTRLLFVVPIWWVFTLPPISLITTRRVVLTIGTIVLSWHSRPARVSRVIMWRSKSMRHAATFLTGLSFDTPQNPASADVGNTGASATAAAARRAADGKTKQGVKFTFVLYENQRRWLGIGWTHNMLAYERAAWTDEYMNPSSSSEAFELPPVEGGLAQWRWCEDSTWHVEDDATRPEREAERRKRASSGGSKSSAVSERSTAETDVDEEDKGWIYYDTKWQNGRRGVDGWGRYTRRRKWVRDAELVELTPSIDVTPTPSPRLAPDNAYGDDDDRTALPELDAAGDLLTPDRAKENGNLIAVPESRGHTRAAQSLDSNGSATGPALPEKEHRSWFRRRRDRSRGRSSSTAPSVASTTGAASVTSESRESDAESVMTKTTRDDDDGYVPMRGWERKWGYGEDVGMELG